MFCVYCYGTTTREKRELVDVCNAKQRLSRRTKAVQEVLALIAPLGKLT